MAAFREVWQDDKKRSDKKLWREYFSSPVFLAAQREDGFPAALLDFVEKEVKNGAQLSQRFLRELAIVYGIRSQSKDYQYLSGAAFPGIDSIREILRLQNAQIIFESYDGIRVPRSAVRVNAQPLTDEDGEALLDSNGNPITRNLTCVYCLWGEKARSKPVTILWQEEEYILVAPDEEALGKYAAEQTKESRRLRAGDEVITAAADLYDGKVIR